MTSDIPAVFTAARTSTFRYELLDVDDQVIGEIAGVTGGNLDWSAATTLKAGGSINVADVDGIDWLTARVKIWRRVGDREWARGVYIPAAPVEAWTFGRRTWSVELLGKLHLLDQDVQGEWVTAAAGINIIDRVRALLTAAGHRNLQITDSPSVLRNPLTWEPGTTLLRIVNDLLDAAGYWSMTADEDGAFVAAPYVRPADRTPRYRLDDGEHTGIYRDEFTRERDVYSIPNRVVIVGQATGDTAALIGVAENNNPASPYSIPARNMVVSYQETGYEAATQAIINDYARRRLTEKTSVGETIPLEIAPIPLDLNDVVTFTNRPAGIDGRYSVQSINEPLDPLTLMTINLREVIDL